MDRRSLSATLACVSLTVALAAPGCAIFENVRDAGSGFVNIFKPRSKDYGDNDLNVDEWSMRQEARGDQPMSKESDFLEDLIQHPKSKAINRSLGVE
jgi:hypothetical protein